MYAESIQKGNPVTTWKHPKTAQIIDIMCAMDPEFGSGVVGNINHSHNPEDEECYWCYLVGPKIDEALTT